ncbi:biotin carboxylase N-terminal domain-containing protein [Nocardioides marinquilinus]|uniref:Biotin carboxylase N-terminal domain-containing protein n=1 Tax=Nocardioides marinquilinus TaxID=1210400 RepID=A0ABP9P9R6_9ACTN
MITRLLVANRGEIASRVFRTCRRLGIETVAVHSDADAGLPYVREADHVVRLPGVSPTETYLRADLLIEAAKRAGADAVHPGYGFLSENADFARAVMAVGLTWVGPPPDAIEAMGSKVEAKRIMAEVGVPVLRVLREPTADDLPLLVKADAGGGGRGMRVVRTLEALDAELEQARAEAESAFGNGRVFVEHYVEKGRHVEVQVLGTEDGVIVLGERDCSLQRRHQKVVEETPAPGLSDPTRQAMHEAARLAAAAIDYLGAGTVEFLYDVERDVFSFLEMNTRLQVEHPVTEAVHGVDLVELQLAVAEGLVVTGHPDPLGHAIEVRLYAEDPTADYAPQSGRLTRFEIPDDVGIRVDAGVESGSEVGTHYDAMLAKVIAHASTREQAARKLAATLRRARIHGLATNRDQLVGLLTHPDFVAGRVDTAFLAEHPPVVEVEPHPETAVAAAIALAERARAARVVQQGVPVAWRNVVSQPQRTELERDGHTTVVEWYGGRDGYRLDGFTVAEASPERVTLEMDGVITAYDVSLDADDERRVDVDGPTGHTRFTVVPRFADPAASHARGSLLAPMPGTVVSIAVEAGAEVSAGDAVLVLEAMKMQHTVTAPHDGVVAQVGVTTGAQVAAGEVLAVVEAAGTGTDTDTDAAPSAGEQ